ncbi:response regulator [Sulfurimonas aquatica]|uniref:Response regulator n=1 Tax=Sulfurimonas aquatica TaxID=2672570 RepID=A0A975AY81_9BACT|nr:response regulator [Sulfurimonas aquatica]QSZ40766.1 response regulator [Sulfurimonas aquatica]
MNKKWNILFIKDENSIFDTSSDVFADLFNKADVAPDRHKALKLIFANEYDIIIQDIGTDPIYGTTFIKQIKQMKPTQVQVAFVLTSDEEKIGGLIDLGVNSFLLEPQQLPLALEAVSQMNPYLKKESNIPV